MGCPVSRAPGTARSHGDSCDHRSRPPLGDRTRPLARPPPLQLTGHHRGHAGRHVCGRGRVLPGGRPRQPALRRQRRPVVCQHRLRARGDGGSHPGTGRTDELRTDLWPGSQIWPHRVSTESSSARGARSPTRRRCGPPTITSGFKVGTASGSCSASTKSYHGSTYLAASLTFSGNYHETLHVVDVVRKFAAPYPYRAPGGLERDDFVDYLIEKRFQRVPSPPASISHPRTSDSLTTPRYNPTHIDHQINNYKAARKNRYVTVLVNGNKGHSPNPDHGCHTPPPRAERKEDHEAHRHDLRADQAPRPGRQSRVRSSTHSGPALNHTQLFPPGYQIELYRTVRKSPRLATLSNQTKQLTVQKNCNTQLP